MTDRWALTAGRTRGREPCMPDPAVQVVAERGDQQHHHQGHQGPVDEELLEGQREDEVGDVPVELRVGGVEGRAVPEEEPVVPLADGLGADDERQHHHTTARSQRE